ncbi:phage holin family protein [Candidatus Kaiserbacteria bacterium]|nr:MAG: phage holin family protein [Candidatus Kaiserbacteria bacterium]
MRMFIRLALIVLALLASERWIPGIEVESFYIALIVAILLGLASITIKPLLTILTLPIHLVTFGLSAFLVNAGIFWFLSTFIEGFAVAGFIPALLGSLAVSLAGTLGTHFS